MLHPADHPRDATDLPMQAEREADAFASEFLMPEAAFGSEWDKARGHPLLARVLKVKRIFRVSYKTVLYRLVESACESPDVQRALRSRHRNHFGKTLRKTDEPTAFRTAPPPHAWPERCPGRAPPGAGPPYPSRSMFNCLPVACLSIL